MKIKKHLQKTNEEINNKIIENGNDVYNALMVENNFNHQETMSYNRKNKKLVWTFSLSSVFVLVVTISLILSFSLLKNNKSINYHDEDGITIECNLTEINNADNKIDINTDQFTYSCNKTYDKSSGDTLYYSITLTHKTDFLEGQIIIQNNKNYSYKEHYSEEKTTTTYAGYTMIYSVQLDESDMLPLNKFFGCIEIGKTKVYFEFSGVAFECTTPNLFLDQALIIE